jgi:hypothetical protein
MPERFDMVLNAHRASSIISEMLIEPANTQDATGSLVLNVGCNTGTAIKRT